MVSSILDAVLVKFYHFDKNLYFEANDGHSHANSKSQSLPYSCLTLETEAKYHDIRIVHG